MELLENISQITNPELDLNSITILGLRLGDSKNNIPQELISEGPYGGWLHTKSGITIRISEKEPEKIIEFIIKPELLGNLKLTKKKRIEKRFGKALSIEQKSGSTYYFYDNQNLVISWNNSSDELSCIYVGENIIKQTKFNVKDFLDKFYEFKGMVPDYSQWNSRVLKNNQPRFYRLKELQSLMSAFGIGSDLLEDFQNRGFLKRRSIEDFRPILNDIEKYATNNEFEKTNGKMKLKD